MVEVRTGKDADVARERAEVELVVAAALVDLDPDPERALHPQPGETDLFGQSGQLLARQGPRRTDFNARVGLGFFDRHVQVRPRRGEAVEAVVADLVVAPFVDY